MIYLPMLQSKPIKSFDKMIAIHNTHQTHSNFHIFKFCVLLILYTRLFTKLNLFEILFYVTFITTKVSRSTVYIYIYIPKIGIYLIENNSLMIKFKVTYSRKCTTSPKYCYLEHISLAIIYDHSHYCILSCYCLQLLCAV